MIKACFSGAATVYAIIRRDADGYAWNGSAYEAFNGANWDDYDIPATDRDGDMKTITVPAGIDLSQAAHIEWRVQAGGAPAETDNRIGIFQPLVSAEELAGADQYIDTTTTPWSLQYRERGTSRVLLTKNLLSTAGANITDTTTAVGRKVQA